jgi:hypothetical protein
MNIKKIRKDCINQGVVCVACRCRLKLKIHPAEACDFKDGGVYRKSSHRPAGSFLLIRARMTFQ